MWRTHDEADIGNDYLSHFESEYELNEGRDAKRTLYLAAPSADRHSQGVLGNLPEDDKQS